MHTESFITRLTLTNFLSFGPGSKTPSLSALNVLIGPNGSGKSNFVEALAVLRAVPRDLPLPIRQGGGVQDWLYSNGATRSQSARLEAVFGAGWLSERQRQIRYALEFGATGASFTVLDERLENADPDGGKSKPYFYFGYEAGKPTINTKANQHRELERAAIDPTQSILSQRRDPETYPELSRLAGLLNDIFIYRSWQFGPDAAVRVPCRADARADRLEENFDNLAARLLTLYASPLVKQRLVAALRALSPSFDDISVRPEGGRLTLSLVEHGTRLIPAQRLSDGTLRYLCLLAVLLEPSASPLVVLEEPELGLHPDVLPSLRDLLLEASSQTQLVVTTHSTQLVDALTEHPECVVVCEKGAEGSLLTRVAATDVQDGEGLGHTWMSGALGGTRW